MIYLDNNSSTKLCQEALVAMLPWLRDNWANPSSVHEAGRLANSAVRRARGQVAALINCRADEVIFTSCASESNAIAVLGAMTSDGRLVRRIFITSVEHASTNSAVNKAHKLGVEIVAAPVDGDGRLLPDTLDSLGLREGHLLSVHWVNNETGVIQDVAELARRAIAAGALVHIDASQAPGKVLVDLDRVPAHYVTLSAHKMHGPKGVGALIVRDGVDVEPLWIGGFQESGRRGGTENVAGIVAFGAAAEALAVAGQDALDRMLANRNRLEAALLESGAVIIAGDAERAPNTTLAMFPYIEASEMVRHFNSAGIAVSSGSACSSNMAGHSHVLKALGKSEQRGAVRFSTSRETTSAEIDEVIKVVRAIAKGVRVA